MSGVVGHVQGYNPRTGEPVGSPVAETTAEALDAVVRHAVSAGPAWLEMPATLRAAVLEQVATALDAASDELVAMANAETALGVPRLTGEITRTTSQLRLFRDVLRDGSYVDAIVSPADSDTAAPDVRRMLSPIGPVAVFSASNFPFAFSVAGGDTASALAAGCPVIVKAHEAHPQTSRRTADVVLEALATAGAPAGVFAIVFGVDAGAALVRHRDIRAVGFTGSKQGGRALFDVAVARDDPIPFYGELGSVNPVVVLPGAAAEKTTEIAEAYAGSLTLGTGQFCTNPGLLFVPDDSEMLVAIADAVGRTSGGVLLTRGMRDSYRDRTDSLDAIEGVTVVARGVNSNDGGGWQAEPQARSVNIDCFASHAKRLGEEIFGPSGVVVTYRDVAALTDTLANLDGSLTASIHLADSDRASARRLATVLSAKAGRLIFNGWPTGVAVCRAMHHGGPWPATTSVAHTSVGAASIHRWLVPVAFQDCPDDLLPAALQQANPHGIVRRTNALIGH